ncbi:hypothetical protein Micbo1qcDRAFT_171190 [Microdochium bolleyi]|uniref:Uncharacterized protein n=1 Tax=Microdochium bolleyi TaxID=196109 RepID=A0A136JK60_9PEZI|nr:hypothetical protein Micbo1qcDRAFT_171190 [Microdochium bolleyi]
MFVLCTTPKFDFASFSLQSALDHYFEMANSGSGRGRGRGRGGRGRGRGFVHHGPTLDQLFARAPIVAPSPESVQTRSVSSYSIGPRNNIAGYSMDSGDISASVPGAATNAIVISDSDDDPLSDATAIALGAEFPDSGVDESSGAAAHPPSSAPSLTLQIRPPEVPDDSADVHTPKHSQQTTEQAPGIIGSLPSAQTQTPRNGGGVAEWWTFVAKAPCTKAWAVHRANYFSQEVGSDFVERLEENEQSPITMDIDDVGIVWVEAGMRNDDGSFNIQPNQPVQVRLYRFQEEPIHNETEGGWQIYNSGTVPASKIRFGKPYATPNQLDLPRSCISTPELKLAQNSMFYLLQDSFFQVIAANADNLPSVARLDQELVDMMREDESRQQMVEALVEGRGFQASREAGSWSLLKDGPAHPREVWKSGLEVDASRADEYAGYRQHIYAIRERAEIPVGTMIKNNTVYLPGGDIIPNCQVFGLQDTVEPTTRVREIWGCYEGVTNNMSRRFEEHSKLIREAASSRVPVNGSHYRMSQLISRFHNFKFKVFRLLSFRKDSAMMSRAGGRYIAEQCMISMHDTYNPVRLQEASHVSNDSLKEVTSMNLVDLSLFVSMADSLRQCQEIARDVVGLPPLGFPDEVVYFKDDVPWIRLPVRDSEGTSIKYVYPRSYPVSIIKNGDINPGYSITIRPGNIGFKIDKHDALPEGGKVHVTWELCADGHGPHPMPWLSVPDPGPIVGLWRRSQDLALRIQYRGTDGKLYKQYLTAGPGKSRGVDAGASAVARALVALPYRFDVAIAVMAFLDQWTWEGGSVPDWVARFPRMSVAQIHELDYNFVDRVWKLTPISATIMAQPALVADGVIERAILVNRPRLEQLIPDDHKGLLPIGDLSLGNGNYCELENLRKTTKVSKAPEDRRSEEVTLADGTITHTSPRCRALLRECVFMGKQAGRQAQHTRQRQPYLRVFGLPLASSADRLIPEFQTSTIYEALRLATEATAEGEEEAQPVPFEADDE